MPFFCVSSNWASRRRQDRFLRSKGYRRLRKGLTQCARRVAAFESSDEYTTMAPWAASAYSWDLVLQYLEDTRVATPPSASIYQTAPVLFTRGEPSTGSRPLSFRTRWSPATYRNDAIPVPVSRGYSSEDAVAYLSDETASVTSICSSSASESSSTSTQSSLSTASYTIARASFISKPVERWLPIRPLISGPRIELYLGWHPDKPLVCPFEHVLAHNDFVSETEWDGFEDWDVTDDHGRPANGKFEQSRSHREVVDLLVQLPRRKPLSIREERKTSVRRVQQWLDSLMPRYTSHRTAHPLLPGVIDDEANVYDDENLSAWPSPPRPLRRTVAYPEIGRVFQDCEKWPTSTFTACFMNHPGPQLETQESPSRTRLPTPTPKLNFDATSSIVELCLIHACSARRAGEGGGAAGWYGTADSAVHRDYSDI